MPIYGVKDVSTKEYQCDNCGMWNILVRGGCLGELCSLPFVDEARNSSTCVHQINQWFGIATASVYLWKELYHVTGDDINQCYPQLFMSFMTFSGNNKSKS